MSKRFSILLVVLTIVSGLIGGAITGRIFTPKVAIAEETTQSKVLTVEGLRVVDKDGKLLMNLGKGDKAPLDSYGLFVFDNSGNVVVRATIDVGKGKILVSGEAGNAMMSVGKSGGGVIVTDKSGEVGAMIGVKESGGVVAVNDKSGEARATMDADESGGSFCVVGKDGEPKAVIGVSEDGNGSIVLFDKDGYELK